MSRWADVSFASTHFATHDVALPRLCERSKAAPILKSVYKSSAKPALVNSFKGLRFASLPTVVRATYRVLGSDSCFAQLFSFSACELTLNPCSPHPLIQAVQNTLLILITTIVSNTTSNPQHDLESSLLTPVNKSTCLK
jgi:hypothetical protein